MRLSGVQRHEGMVTSIFDVDVVVQAAVQRLQAW